MTHSRARIVRGRATQRIAAEFMRFVWPTCESVEAFLAGCDLKNTPGWRVEIKATQDGSLTGAMKQAANHPGEGTPVVIWRPDGYGPERVGDWIVAMRLKDFREIVGKPLPLSPQEVMREAAFETVPRRTINDLLK